MGNPDTPGFKGSSGADTNPIPVALIQAKLAEEAAEPAAHEAAPVAEEPAPAADAGPAGPMTAGTQVINLPPVPAAEPEPDAAVGADAPPQPEPEPQPARPAPTTEGTRVMALPPLPAPAAPSRRRPQSRRDQPVSGWVRCPRARPSSSYPSPPGPLPGAPCGPAAPAARPDKPPVRSAPRPTRPAPPPAAAPPVVAPRQASGPPAPAPPQPDPRFNPPAAPVATPFTRAAPSAPQPPPGYQDPRIPSHTDLGLVRARPLPQRGWRRAVHRLTGLNPGESELENTRQKLVARVSQPVRGDYSIAVLSMKGGVGKTTTTVGLGSTFAAIRGDRVIAVDANPDFGTLAQRGPDQSRSTVRDLLLDDNIFRYSDIRRHTSQSTSRLEILASERDPATSEAFSDADYRVVIRLLQRFYNLILTDCGTGLVHSAMSAILDEADAIVLVASPAIDAARSAFATLDWLEHHGRGHLVPNATVVISAARPGKASVDLDKLAAQFLTRIRSVHVIPFDDHLAQGSEIVLDLMANRTRQAFLELAASIADGFADTKRAASRH
ncbi:MinD/ParA family ATP-binding protein [Mycobacterium kiyosense]|nr:hypothetical protein IWGMT90018_41360 [Mycobacterium kiyosense]